MLIDPTAPRPMTIAVTLNATTVLSSRGHLTMCHGTIVNHSDSPTKHVKQQKIVDVWEHKDFTQNDFALNDFDKNNFDKNNFDKNNFDKNNSGSNNSGNNNLDRNNSDKRCFDKKGTTRKTHLTQGTGMKVVKVDAASYAEELHITLDHSSWLSHES
jgi:hypothetical protein